MYQVFKNSFIALLAIILIGCSTTKTNSAEEQNKINTAQINVQLGIAYLEQHDTERAKKKLLLALDEAPNIPETWYSMGYFLETTGNKDEANNYYLKALKIAGERGDVQNNYGTFLCREGKNKEAIQHFLLAVKDPNYLDPADAYENAGLCAMKIPNPQLAKKYFNNALLQDPSRPVTLLKLAEINFQEEKYPAAQNMLTQFNAISAPTLASKHLSEMLAAKLSPHHADHAISPNKIIHKNKSITSFHGKMKLLVHKK
jgi:type IV pilus assembly protein PilF